MSNITEPESIRKLFFSRVNSSTCNNSINEYFKKFGTVVRIDHKRYYSNSNKFGFITYASSKSVDDVMRNTPHILDSKIIMTRRAIPSAMKSLLEFTDKKISISKINSTTWASDLRAHFSCYGDIAQTRVEDVAGVRTGYIEFNDSDSVDKLFIENKTHMIKGTKVEIQKSMISSSNTPSVSLIQQNENQPTPKEPSLASQLSSIQNNSSSSSTALKNISNQIESKKNSYDSGPGPMRVRLQRNVKSTVAPYLAPSNLEKLNLNDCMCSICLDILIEPVKLPCKHEFCLKCFDSMNMISNTVCPYCRAKVNYDWIITSRINKTLVDINRWKDIQRCFPKEIQNKQTGKTAHELEEDLSKPNHLIAKPGEIYNEYLSMIKKEQERKEEEEKKSLELIQRILRGEDVQQEPTPAAPTVPTAPAETNTEAESDADDNEESSSDINSYDDDDYNNDDDDYNDDNDDYEDDSNQYDNDSDEDEYQLNNVPLNLGMQGLESLRHELTGFISRLNNNHS